VIKRVAFTIQPISNVSRARRFYEETLGLEVGMAGGQGDTCWIEYDLPGGGCLALTNTTGDQPSDSAGATVALEVENLEATMTELAGKGVTFKSEVIRGPRCRMAVCLDSEGNSILLHQLD
jgi:predicted enzyme related to lactoylglutathione lyase